MSKSPPFQKMGGFRNDLLSVSFQDFGYNSGVIICQNEYLRNTENFNIIFRF